MSNSVKAFLAGLCSIAVFFIILFGCLYTLPDPHSDDLMSHIILTLIFLIVIPIVQYALSRSLKSAGKEEIGRVIGMSIGIELILLVLIIAIIIHLTKLR